MLALIDSDILVYRVGFTTEDLDEALAMYRMDESIQRILDAVDTKQSRHYLTSQDRSNFRFALFEEYKAHRKQPKPRHYLLLRNYLIEEYGAVVVEGQEADDQLGIDHDKVGDTTIICTIDKDMDQVPGWHYNFVKMYKYKITPLEATRQFYYQCLVGDKSTDNIEGCPGIGPVKANRMLEGCENEQEMLEVVVKQYQKAYGNEFAQKLWLAGQLLWIRKQPKQSWELLSGEVVSKDVLESFYLNQESLLNSSPESTDTLFQPASTTT